MCIFKLLYLSEARPFLDSEDTLIEAQEELTVPIVACCLPDFTDILDNNEMKWNLGWFIIIVLFFNLFLNTVIIIRSMIRTLVRVYKMAKYKIAIIKRDKLNRTNS